MKPGDLVAIGLIIYMIVGLTYFCFSKKDPLDRW